MIAWRLDRLLGPAEPELSCEACFEELDRYVEAESRGEDADRTVPAMAAHLRGCPACAEEQASLLALITGPPATPLEEPWSD